MDSWKLSLILLAGSLLVSALFWSAGLPFFFLFLFVPLFPFLFRRRGVRRCPACGWETTGDEQFCPYDATPLGAGGEAGDMTGNVRRD
jgi:hypothetical protein